jgi:thiopeptide-type bacteriocin biosynthesis protein
MSRWRWHSVHLHQPGDIFSRQYDVRIVSLLETLESDATWQQLATGGWFFVRYSDDGDHLRVRLRAHSPLPDRAVRETFAAVLASRDHGWVPRWVPYIPERARYGGPVGMRIAERAFRSSSRAVVSLLAASLRHGARRCHTEALLCMLAMAQMTSGEAPRAVDFLRSYACANARRIVPARSVDAWYAATRSTMTAAVDHCREAAVHVLQSVRDGAQVDGPLGAFLVDTRQMLRIFQRLAATSVHSPLSQSVEQVSYSLIHMHNNRLGISNMAEAQLAVAASALMEECA